MNLNNLSININISDDVPHVLELKIDSELSSLNELENSLNDYEAKYFCNFTKSNSRTIEGAKEKNLKRYINPKLNSYRSKCPVVIRIRPDETGEKLMPFLPSRVPKRDRPKCKDKTVISVPKKNKLKTNLLPFENFPADIKQYEILCWFIHDTVAKSAVFENKTIHKKNVETVPEKVMNAVFDKAISIKEIKCYLTEESWLAIQQVIQIKTKTPT